jgi:hypothetical protein
VEAATSRWQHPRRPAAVELATIGLPGRCGSGTECNEEGHEAGAAEELGDKDNGVALCFGTVNQLQRAKAGNGSVWPAILGSPSASGRGERRGVAVERSRRASKGSCLLAGCRGREQRQSRRVTECRLLDVRGCQEEDQTLVSRCSAAGSMRLDRNRTSECPK